MLLVLMLMSGCVTVSTNAICDGLVSDVDALTVALAVDGGPQAQAAGVRLISGFDGACGL